MPLLAGCAVLQEETEPEISGSKTASRMDAAGRVDDRCGARGASQSDRGSGTSVRVHLLVAIAILVARPTVSAVLLYGRDHTFALSGRDERQRPVRVVDVEDVEEHLRLCETLGILVKQLTGDVLVGGEARY